MDTPSGKKLDYKDALMQWVDGCPLPDLGDAKKMHSYAFTDEEMNTIVFAVSFSRSALFASPLEKIRGHYGAALEKIAARFARSGR